jgi:hypothetical protein
VPEIVFKMILRHSLGNQILHGICCAKFKMKIYKGGGTSHV